MNSDKKKSLKDYGDIFIKKPMNEISPKVVPRNSNKNIMIEQPIILIVEDNSITRKMLRIALECEHYAILEAANGKTALQLVKEHKIDLILQDLILPDMNGFELNKKIRDTPNVANISIIGLSGFLNKLDEMRTDEESGFSTFLLKPVEISHLIEIVNEYLPTVSKVPKVGEGQHILLVDDNATQLKLLKLQLTNAGFLVDTAVDGEDALRKIENELPDAVVSDILMPRLDGFELCLKIRNHPLIANIPIILLTSHYLEHADHELGRKVAANYFLTRLPQATELIDKLMECLKNKTRISRPEKVEILKEEHTHRLIRQLERQITTNKGLLRRCSLQSAQLSLLKGIDAALTTSSGIENTLQDVLSTCLDAAGISQGLLFDIILCDLNMPDVSGKEVYLGLCQLRPELANHFILMTGGAFIPLLTKFIEEYNLPYIEKPFSLEKLIEKIEEISKK